MRGVLTVFRKELTDHFASKKFLILIALVYIAGLASTYVALQNIRDVASALDQFVFLKLYTTGGDVLPSFISFISFFIPIIGIIFGFDAINSERNSGNLSRLMSQPIYRDSVINGKFLAGVTTLSIIVASIAFIIAGVGLTSIGVPPTSEEILRIFFLVFICVFYGGFWMGLSILFSVVMERTAASILTAIAIWIFLMFFLPIIAYSCTYFLYKVKLMRTKHKGYALLPVKIKNGLKHLVCYLGVKTLSRFIKDYKLWTFYKYICNTQSLLHTFGKCLY